MGRPFPFQNLLATAPLSLSESRIYSGWAKSFKYTPRHVLHDPMIPLSFHDPRFIWTRIRYSSRTDLSCWWVAPWFWPSKGAVCLQTFCNYLYWIWGICATFFLAVQLACLRHGMARIWKVKGTTIVMMDDEWKWEGNGVEYLLFRMKRGWCVNWGIGEGNTLFAAGLKISEA